jgi:predicted ATPase
MLLAHISSQGGVGGADLLSNLLLLLNDQSSLVILDCCKHLIDAACDLAERLRAGAEGCWVLRTSREALSVACERRKTCRRDAISYKAKNAAPIGRVSIVKQRPSYRV